MTHASPVLCAHPETQCHASPVLGGNELGAEGGAALAEALKVTSCPIRGLHQAGNGLGAEGGAALAEALKVTSCPIRELRLGWNGLEPDAEAVIASALADCKRRTRNWRLRSPLVLFWLSCRFGGESAAWRARGRRALLSASE